MSSLNQFFRPVEIAEQPMEELKAYKMDEPINGSPDMRRFVGLGECNCCDYFLPKGEVIILIEETQLSRQMQSLRSEYPYPNDNNNDDFAIKRIHEEMRLKAYGSMLVLCRLAAKCGDAEKMFQKKKFAFWVIASSITVEDKNALDNLKDNLLAMLGGALGREIVDSVEVFPADMLKEQLRCFGDTSRAF